MQTRRVWQTDNSNRQTPATRQESKDIRQEKAAVVETRADEIMARVSKMAGGKIYLAFVVQCYPTIFISCARPTPVYCDEHVYIFTYLTA
jgi:hypothetical protein